MKHTSVSVIEITFDSATQKSRERKIRSQMTMGAAKTFCYKLNSEQNVKADEKVFKTYVIR